MLTILYEDRELIVVKKPAGLEAQTARGFAPDMVSELRRYLAGCAAVGQEGIHRLSTMQSTAPAGGQPPYVGVIHRLDKPVSGVMVYGKTPKAAASLSRALQAGNMKKEYLAVVCGKPVDNSGTYVDYLRKDGKNNCSEIVDKSVEGGRRAVLRYRVREVIRREEDVFSLVEIELLTGRHHQIRVQLAGHGTPLVGDGRYGAAAGGMQKVGRGRLPLALCACRLTFPHPIDGREMCFETAPEEGAFSWFGEREN